MEDNKERKVDKYVSRDGFERVPLNRGFLEIRSLFNILTDISIETKSKIFICGGYARYCASPLRNPIVAKDVDIYSESEETFNFALKAFKETFGLEIRHENGVSITFKNPPAGNVLELCPTIQLIKPLNKGHIVTVGNVETILSNFDFTVVRAAIMDSETAIVDKDFLHDEEKEQLRLKNIHCPVSSMFRCIKYCHKGYWLPVWEGLKLFIDWEQRDQEYRDKLISFLTEAKKGEGLSKEQVEELEALMRID